MSLPTPNTPKEVQDDAKTDVQKELPKFNPFASPIICATAIDITLVSFSIDKYWLPSYTFLRCNIS